MTFCNHCSMFKCSKCSKRYHNNLTELLYVYQINRKLNKLCHEIYSKYKI